MRTPQGSPISIMEGCVIGVSHAICSWGVMFKLAPSRQIINEGNEYAFAIGNKVPLPKNSYILEMEHGNEQGSWYRLDDKEEMNPREVYAVPREWLEQQQTPRGKAYWSSVEAARLKAINYQI